MPIEILDTNSSNSHSPPETAPEAPKTLTLELVGQLGTASFHVPTIGALIDVERENPSISPGELCRRLAEISLIDWAGSPKTPSDDEIDIEDDFAIIELFSAAITPDNSFEVLPDKSHQVELTVGKVTFRRPSRVDARKAEQLTKSGAGQVNADIAWACGLCMTWWRSDRPIMPADFDKLPLDDYAKLQAALKAFFRRRAQNDRAGVS